jgi:hypothetical protein
VQRRRSSRASSDTGIALVELLAYAADALAYHQDQVGNEAYLQSERRRRSIRCLLIAALAIGVGWIMGRRSAVQPDG